MAAAVAEADQGGVTSGLIDCGLFDPIQLHYVAPPELGAGAADPCPRGRVLLVDGSVVPVPDDIAAEPERGETYTLKDGPMPPGGWG
jgi:hypothetical protein